jgi:hypothetical protein
MKPNANPWYENGTRKMEQSHGQSGNVCNNSMKMTIDENF